MKRRAFLLGTGSAAVGGTALLTSGAFTRTEPQRNVMVETVGDDDAYLRLAYETDQTVDCEGEITVVNMTNHLKTGQELTDIQFDFTSSNPDVTLSNPDTPDSLGVGNTYEVTIDVDCDGASGETTIEFEIDASASGSKVEVSREIEIVCDSCVQTTDGKEISFAAFSAPSDDLSVTTTVTHENEDGEPTGISWETSEPVDEVVLKGGQEWYAYTYPGGASSGSGVMMSANAADYDHKGKHPFQFTDDQGNTVDDNDRCPPSPCDGKPAVKVNVETGTEETAASNCK